MSFEKKKFFKLFNSLLPIEKAVLSELLNDLMEFNYRKKLFLPQSLRNNTYWLKTIPDDRKLSDKIEKTFDLKNRKHRKAYIEKSLFCLGILKSINVLDYFRLPFSPFYPKHKLIMVNEENLIALMGILKNVDLKTFELPLFKIMYDEPVVLLAGVDEKIGSTYSTSQAGTVFKYVFEHPNRDITKDDINGYLKETESKAIINRDLDDIFEEIGFLGDLNKVFLKKCKKNIVHLRNPVFFNDLKVIGIDYCEPDDLMPQK